MIFSEATLCGDRFSPGRRVGALATKFAICFFLFKVANKRSRVVALYQIKLRRHKNKCVTVFLVIFVQCKV